MTVSVSPVIVAVHVAIRVNVAVEIGGITVDVRRVNIAAPLCSRCPSREVIERILPVNKFIFFINYTYVIFISFLFNCLLVPTLTFGTIRRHIWLLKIFAYAKIDSRLQDARGGPLLEAYHRAFVIHITGSGSPAIDAEHAATRVHVADETGGTTADARRGNKAAVICS